MTGKGKAKVIAAVFAAGIVDNFLEEVLGAIFGRFLGTHRPWRWRQGRFFGGRGALGKMGKRFFAVFDPLFARF